jgi:hypothetical protein
MMREDRGEIIELAAVNPEGDLACDISIATAKEREGLPEGLRRYMRPPVRGLPDGVLVEFAPEGWAAVQRYVDLESKCCSFLTLRAELTGDAVRLTVTGRPEAKPWIDQIFAQV